MTLKPNSFCGYHETFPANMAGDTVYIYKLETETTMGQGQLHYLATLTVPLNVINQYVPCMTC
jgi:hypothetical protein